MFIDNIFINAGSVYKNIYISKRKNKERAKKMGIAQREELKGGKPMPLPAKLNSNHLNLGRKRCKIPLAKELHCHSVVPEFEYPF